MIWFPFEFFFKEKVFVLGWGGTDKTEIVFLHFKIFSSRWWNLEFTCLLSFNHFSILFESLNIVKNNKVIMLLLFETGSQYMALPGQLLTM